MTETDHLLLKLSEECIEIAKEIHKAACFGLDHGYPGEATTNRQNIEGELQDLMFTLEVLEERGVLRPDLHDAERRARKRARLFEYMAFARKQGQIYDRQS